MMVFNSVCQIIKNLLSSILFFCVFWTCTLDLPRKEKVDAGPLSVSGDAFVLSSSCESLRPHFVAEVDLPRSSGGQCSSVGSVGDAICDHSVAVLPVLQEDAVAARNDLFQGNSLAPRQLGQIVITFSRRSRGISLGAP